MRDGGPGCFGDCVLALAATPLPCFIQKRARLFKRSDPSTVSNYRSEGSPTAPAASIDRLGPVANRMEDVERQRVGEETRFVTTATLFIVIWFASVLYCLRDQRHKRDLAFRTYDQRPSGLRASLVPGSSRESFCFPHRSLQVPLGGS